MKIDLTPMIEPEYISWTETTKIPLSGRVLIFGSGQLLHELKIFDFTDVVSILAYDPFSTLDKTRLDTDLANKTQYKKDWAATSDAIKKDNVHNIICMFSLHYEPQWLRLFQELINGLEIGGSLYFSEDAGFRAVLDGSPAALEGYPQIRDVFRERLTTDQAAPWLPDFSASDASLLREILELFGDTELVLTLDAKRRTFRALEPECYLPWNNERTEISKDLVERVRKTTPRGAVKEQVLVYKFTKSGIHPDKLDLFDLKEPRSRMVWRALSDRTGRAVGRLIVSQTTGDARQNDYPFRKAALAVLYQNALRHFSFWRAAELVVGALNPEIARQQGDEPYLFACITPSRRPRFWGASYLKPPFLTAYETRLKSRGLNWVGEQLYIRGRGGVYCWLGVDGSLADDEAWTVIREPELVDEFAQRSTPPCVYVIDPLATTDPFLVSTENQLLYGAMIIYLNTETNDDLARELQCLLFVLETSRSIVVGRAGFLEMELLKEAVRNSAAIQGPLSILQKHQGALSDISDAVEVLAARLGRGFRVPGLPFMEAIERILRASNLFRGAFHNPEKEKPERLIPVAMKPEMLENQKKLEEELQSNGIERSVTERLFRPISPHWIVEHTSEAIGFAKILWRTGVLPTNWVFAAFDKNPKVRYYSTFIQLEDSDLNPLQLFAALCVARRESITTACFMQGDHIRCAFSIRQNYRGPAGLSILKKLIESDEGGGNTATSLRIIRQAAKPKDFNVELGAQGMEVVVKYALNTIKDSGVLDHDLEP